MTVEELLDSLKSEWNAIEGRYQEQYERLGQQFFRNQTAPGCWPVQEAVGEIQKMRDRQDEITQLRRDIETARNKTLNKSEAQQN